MHFETIANWGVIELSKMQRFKWQIELQIWNWNFIILKWKSVEPFWWFFWVLMWKFFNQQKFDNNRLTLNWVKEICVHVESWNLIDDDFWLFSLIWKITRRKDVHGSCSMDANCLNFGNWNVNEKWKFLGSMIWKMYNWINFYRTLIF